MKFMLLSDKKSCKSVIVNLDRVESMEPFTDDDRRGTYVNFDNGRTIIVEECFVDICEGIGNII